MSDYYTHRPYLKKELESLKNDTKIICLELGTGDGSALIFEEYAKSNKNIKIMAYESDYEWLNKTRETYGLDNYIFTHIDNWDEFLSQNNFNEIYDLVFVDQTPWEARIKSIDTLKDKSKTIILHDFDFFNIGVCEDVYSVKEGSYFHTKYGKDFELIAHYEQLPPTLVMKNKNL
jgi:hypothetical protein